MHARVKTYDLQFGRCVLCHWATMARYCIMLSSRYCKYFYLSLCSFSSSRSISRQTEFLRILLRCCPSIMQTSRNKFYSQFKFLSSFKVCRSIAYSASGEPASSRTNRPLWHNSIPLLIFKCRKISFYYFGSLAATAIIFVSNNKIDDGADVCYGDRISCVT